MKFKISSSELGEVKLTIFTLSDKGATPTELEDPFNELIKEFSKNSTLQKYKLQIDPKSIHVKKLNEKRVSIIKKYERRYVDTHLNSSLTKYEYYALVFIAMQKLRFTTMDGKKISQPRFAKIFEFRRPSLTEAIPKVRPIEGYRKEIYIELERLLEHN